MVSGAVILIAGSVWIHCQYAAMGNRPRRKLSSIDRVELSEPLNDSSVADPDAVADTSDDNYAAPTGTSVDTQPQRTWSDTFLMIAARLAGFGMQNPPEHWGPKWIIGDALCLFGIYGWKGNENVGEYRIKPIYFIIFAVLDWMDVILDFALVDELRRMGRHKHATFLGVGTTIMLVVQLWVRLVFSSSRFFNRDSRSDLFLLCVNQAAVEVVIFLLEDCATIYAFADVPGLFNPTSHMDVINLFVTLTTASLCAAPLALSGACLCSCWVLTACAQDKEGADDLSDKYMHIMLPGTALFIIYTYQIWASVKFIIDGEIPDSNEQSALNGMFYFSFACGIVSLIVYMTVTFAVSSSPRK